MYNKYFTVEVKPAINATLLDAGAVADDDLLFSWTPFEVPKGSSRLLNVTAVVAGNDGTAQHLPFQLLFAKGQISSNHLISPSTLGNYNDVPNGVRSMNEMLGSVKIDTVDYLCQSITGMSIASTGNSVTDSGSSCDMVLTPNYDGDFDRYDQTTVITPGYDVLWVAGIACGAFNFASTVTTDTTEAYSATATTIHTDTKDANLVFAPGDVIQAANNDVIGTITDIGSATGADVDITVDRTGGDGKTIGDGVEIYKRNPITLRFSFEK